MLTSDENQGQSPDNPFAIEPAGTGFESLGHENGFRYWWATDLAKLLGYENPTGFRKAVEKAIVTLSTLGIEVSENVVFVKRDVGGKEVSDTKLSRFACYLSAMNGDPKKPQVAQAQAYFVAWAQACQCSLQKANDVERVAIRAEITDHEKTLAGTANRAGVVNYAYFQNAGYRGLYNMNLNQIRKYKGVPDGRSPLDFMGKTELAANLFRVTQTEEKIRADNVRGQVNLESTAESVGRKVRKTMIEISGRPPEALPSSGDINDVKKGLKSSHREIRRIDSKKS